MEILRVEYHRNGVGGEGFHVVEFTSELADDVADHRMLATVFDGPGQVAVIDIDDLGARWRGDLFEPELRDAIDAANLSGLSFDHR